MLAAIRTLNERLAKCRSGRASSGVCGNNYTNIMPSVDNLRLCLWNATSINNKYAEFNYFLEKYEVDTALVSET